MAEVLHGLRKKLHRKKAMKSSGISKSSTQKSTSTNPYASRGLEKFATLLEDIQIKQQATKSLVERTASSLSAARSISRSAQEWTASTLVRRCSPETTQVLQSAPRVAATTAPVEEVQGNLDNLREEQQPQGCQSNSAPSLGVRLPIRRCRSMTSRSAFVMLLTLSAFLCSRAGRVGKPFLAALTCSAVIQIWRRGKVSARFMFSSVALYLLTPLRSYLVTRIPKQLIVVPQNPENDENDVSVSPVAALPLSPILESRPIESPIPVTLPHTKSPSRRLAKKISSGLKKLKMFRSSSSSVSVHSSSESASAPASPKSSASNHRRTCPFSRKMGAIAETQASDATSSSSRKGGILRRQRSSESVSCSSRVGLRGGRMLSSETLEQYNQAGEGDSIASSACESKRSTSSSSSSASVNHEAAAPVAWHLVGLLVTLLFLLVGRVPAIMATSLFFVVVSPHSRGRERRESRAHWEAAARKLNRSPPPRVGRRAISPPPRWH